MTDNVLTPEQEQQAKDQKKRRRRGVIAGIAGAALLLGGTTFALWSDSDFADGKSIHHGYLGLDVQNVTYQDVTPWRSDAPHTITDLNGYHIVPGSKISAVYDFDIQLLGDNLVAELISTLDSTATTNGIKFTYDLQDVTGKNIIKNVPITYNGTPQILGRVQAPSEQGGTDQDAANVPVITVNGAAELHFVLTAEFLSDDANSYIGQTDVLVEPDENFMSNLPNGSDLITPFSGLGLSLNQVTSGDGV